MWNIERYLASQEIVEPVITDLSNQNLLPGAPPILYHYTSLEVIQKIMEFDDIRLTHAEYSNDQRELEEARLLIVERLGVHPSPAAFKNQVEADYQAQAGDLDVYVFCMSTGIAGNPAPQDMLSQWRAYGQDGRGGCLTLDSTALAGLVHHFPAGLRRNPIIYRRATQVALIDAILTRGHGLYTAGNAAAVHGTVAALTFVTPLMKHAGFEEEREWRLIYTPIQEGPAPRLEFHPRRDFLAPFVRLRRLWDDVRPALRRALGAAARHPPLNVPEPDGDPLILVQSIMVGPSGHQPLNARAMQKVIGQWRAGVGLERSAIPYRSLS